LRAAEAARALQRHQLLNGVVVRVDQDSERVGVVVDEVLQRGDDLPADGVTSADDFHVAVAERGL